MKKQILLVGYLLFTFSLFSQVTLIPDSNFEQALINQNIDSDGIINGQVFTSDISSLSTLNVSNSNITDLTGIADFESLISLDCSNNNLTNLDLSSNYLYSLNCSYNTIGNLDLSNQPELETINCSYNQLTSLTLYPTSNGFFTDTRLYCNNNLLTSLDLSGQYLLNVLDCSYNNINDLSILIGDLLELYVNNNNLTALDFRSSDGIVSGIDFVFDTKSNPNLYCIAVNNPAYCSANYTSNIDPHTSFSTDCSAPITLIPDTNFEQALIDQEIDSEGIINGQVFTSDISELSSLDVSYNNIEDLTGIEDFEDLIALNCSNNSLTELDITNLNLNTLNCSFNSLSTLDLSNQTDLENIDCDYNLLTTLTLINQQVDSTDIRLNCSHNLLTSLDLQHLYLLEELDCSNNQLNNLTVSTASLNKLLANNNNLTELKLNNLNSLAISNSDFDTTINPNLYCIEVDNVTASTSNWTNIDPHTSFSEDCTQVLNTDNNPDDTINLALLDDAFLSGSVSSGRGTPEVILYDPTINDYFVKTDYNEYGVNFGVNLGRPNSDNGFYWQVDWLTPKSINYITFGGAYPNQPQPNTLWKISYLNNDEWITLEEGQGGWVNSDIYEWDGTASEAITADALRVQIYSDGENDLKSIHIRGRGGISFRNNDSNSAIKATLIQYLPPIGSPVADFVTETNALSVNFDASNSLDNETIVGYQWDFGDGYTTGTYFTDYVMPTHNYEQAGTYLVTLRVIDNDGLTDIFSKEVTVSDDTPFNEPDASINLALLDDASLSGSVTGGRGNPEDILYDPSIENYVVRTYYNEYGVGFRENIGRPDADNGFFWQVDWSTPKTINYITFGGTYDNQPQPNAMWRISYLYNEVWITLDEGQGGWIDNGIYQWDNPTGSTITADALRVQVYSDGNNDLVSIHLRGIGGRSYYYWRDADSDLKATLIQYLPTVGTPVADFVTETNELNADFDAGNSYDNDAIVNYLWDFGDGTTANTSDALTSHTYTEYGAYTVTLTVTDNDGLSSDISKIVSINDDTVFNQPDANVNLALLDDASLSGSVSNGRGNPEDILYDPSIDDYFVKTDWNEYGIGFGEQLTGALDADSGFFWQVDWLESKTINYITFGGTYPNQRQQYAMWRISYLYNDQWITLDEGQGGWIDRGIYEWNNTNGSNITADAIRVQVYSDGIRHLESIHLRGRGGISIRNNDSNTTTKATLIQYLPTQTNVAARNEKSIDIMKISPNPTTNRALISFSVDTIIELIELYDLTGRLVRSYKGGLITKDGKQISVQGIPLGIYNIKAISTTGEIYQKKLIKI